MLCSFCGMTLPGDTALCLTHPSCLGDDWAEGNRIYCDFFHRGIAPPRLNATDRNDDFWALVAIETV